ncbi:hypothetical protein ACFY04_04935, partial [Streptomyces sp. NPDC001549]|uniref:hypothetical protein n=1 Tax=Streptomyces sp. NPDC001549 TaxID=3364586 RepID=UPI0036C28166
LDEGKLNSGWTAVTAVGRELLFYNSDNGIIATGRLDTNGHFGGLDEGTLDPGWAIVVSVT